MRNKTDNRDKGKEKIRDGDEEENLVTENEAMYSPDELTDYEADAWLDDSLFTMIDDPILAAFLKEMEEIEQSGIISSTMPPSSDQFNQQHTRLLPISE